MKASQSVNAGMTVADRGPSLAVGAVVRVAIGVVLVRVVLVDRGVISVGLVEGLAASTKIVADLEVVLDFEGRGQVVVAVVRRNGATITAIMHRVRPSSRGKLLCEQRCFPSRQELRGFRSKLRVVAALAACSA